MSDVRPFFASAPRSPECGRLLLLSYHFPPGQAAGALRWQKLAGFAAERGFGLDVFTADPASLPRADFACLEELPAGVRVFAVPDPPTAVQRLEAIAMRAFRIGAHAPAARTRAQVRGPASVARSDLRFRPLSPRSWVRAWDGWLHDARERAWARRAVGLARRVLEPGAHRAVISCGPPQMSHEAAAVLARRTGLPLVLDLRDPWSLVERVPESIACPIRMRRAAVAERIAVERASLVVMNTELARRAMQAHYPAQADRIIAVMNGVDLDASHPAARRAERFVVAYAGAVYLDRNPRLVFRAAARVVRALGLSPDQFGVEFMGVVENGVDLDAMAEEEGLAGFFTLHRAGTRRDAEEFLSGASVLLSLPQDSHFCVPSKLFEYMRYEAALLVLAVRDSSTELVLRDTSADVVDPDDVDGLAEALEKRYAAFAAGRRAEPIASDPRFHRRAQAQRLFEAIERIAESAAGAAPIPPRLASSRPAARLRHLSR